MMLPLAGKRMAAIISCYCFMIGMVEPAPRRRKKMRGKRGDKNRGGGSGGSDIFNRGKPGVDQPSSLKIPLSLKGIGEIETDVTNSFLPSSYFLGDRNNIEDYVTHDFDDTDSKNDLERIVGGQEADVLEYPYFVQTNGGGCGSVLIASEWVLTAAHCGNIQGQQLNIGAYQNFVLANGSQVRTCVRYIEDPGFLCRINERCFGNTNAPFKNDFALCLLNEPVYVNDINVKFQLNEEPSFPRPGSDVQTIGFGTLVSGGSTPQILREVTVQVDSDDECRNAPANEYRFGIGAESICASVDGGGKDSCQGDSGGPLIRRVFDRDDPSKSVHTHVGVTSWGLLCGSAIFPGVYARTSAGIDFIRGTICDDFNSPSSFCKPSITCNKDKEEEKLTIKLVTDFFANETSWELLDVTNNDEVLLSAGLRSLEKNFFTYEDTICLPPGTYEFIIRDAFGDGMVVNTQDFFRFFEGFYSVFLDDVEVDTSRGNDFEFNRTFSFTIDGTSIGTPSPTALPTPLPTPLPAPLPTLPQTSPPTPPPTPPSTSDPTPPPTLGPTSPPTRNPTRTPIRSTSPTNLKRSSPSSSPSDSPSNASTNTITCEDIKSSVILENDSLQKCIWIALEEGGENNCPQMCRICADDRTRAPTPAPSSPCRDNPNYTFNGKTNQFCQRVDRQSQRKRNRSCKRRDLANGNQLVKVFCPKACRECY